MKNIGKYRIVEKIGIGGFGEVYKAHDPFIKRYVAIKTCTSDEQDTRNRFFHEAEIAGRLNHRNITTVYDFGLEDDVPYLIQEYLTGEDLDVKIKRGDDVPYPKKLHYLIQITRGLAYAHQQGVIHRDVKPANIRVLEDDTVKIMDFGIAKLAQQDTGLTKTGMTVGTAAYLAPEQIRGEAVDHRTDIFSFGVLAYELLTYERPFQGEQISAVIYQILNREPRPIVETWPAAPPDIVGLIGRCLAKNADDRFADGNEVQRQLELLQKKSRGATSAIPAAALATREIVTPGPAAPVPAAPMPAAPVPATPVPETAATPETAAARPQSRPQSLDDLELSSVNVDEVRSRAMPVQGAAAARLRYGRWIALAALALVTLVAGWWLGDAGRRERVAGLFGGGSAAEVAEVAEVAGETAAEESTGETAGGETGDGAASETAGGEEAGEEASGEEASGEEATGDTASDVAPPEPEPPPPPPPPEPGRLVVAQVPWSDAVSVRVGNSRYALTNERTFTLEPGTHQVVFELDEPGYQVSRTVTVEIGEGARTRLEAPIAQPGALSVRARPGRAQARITLGDQELGTSPISGRKFAPGEYTVRMQPLTGDEGGLERQVLVAPGEETILTFDLEAGTVHDAIQPLD